LRKFSRMHHPTTSVRKFESRDAMSREPIGRKLG
jgi:hypothetical protein